MVQCCNTDDAVASVVGAGWNAAVAQSRGLQKRRELGRLGRARAGVGNVLEMTQHRRDVSRLHHVQIETRL